MCYGISTVQRTERKYCNKSRKEEKMENLRRGQLYYIKKHNVAQEQNEEPGKPVLILNADKELISVNGTITVANITRRPRYNMDTHMEIQMVGYSAVAILEQAVTIPIERLGQYIGELTEEQLYEVDKIICHMNGIDLEKIIEKYTAEIKSKDEKISILEQKLEQAGRKRRLFKFF